MGGGIEGSEADYDSEDLPLKDSHRTAKRRFDSGIRGGQKRPMPLDVQENSSSFSSVIEVQKSPSLISK